MLDLLLCPPSLFFDLQGFSHPELFSESEPVWNALQKLPSIFLQKAKKNWKFDGVFFENADSIFLGDDCLIEPGVFIKGPCIIGSGTKIYHNAYIRPGCLIGENCVIGHCSEVARSIVLSDAKIPHFNYVGDSIIGKRVNLGAGSKCANVRLDKREISIPWEGRQIKTGLSKLGAIIGDSSSIGCNAVLNPGTILFPKTLIGPCQDVRGVVR